MPKEQPETKIRACRVCNAKYEYPTRGSRATRYHCELCVDIPRHTRAVLEKLSRRIRILEKKNPPK